MALAASAPKMTAEEFFALPGELPHPQLIDGELVVSTPTAGHQRLVAELIGLFHVHRQSHPGCGELGIEIDTVLDEVNVYAPDLWWVPDGRRLADDQSRFGSPPPLVVEVRSPSTWRYDIGSKLRHYEAAGVAEVWLVDTAADVVLVFRRRTSDATTFDVALELTTADTLATPLIDGWTIDLGELFIR
ncbi:Uma2 family endonuclease [Iamia sp.]|uniref:Uma2 family endonuclease n=1 Tax=Iamia sp. TaxID=2722710 RepID=UPI002BA164F9|nr:Uma2 family endonuclease [Iamia sp.]HXH55792.1 Uma2 family endonuclease [Iamia sp.]